MSTPLKPAARRSAANTISAAKTVSEIVEMFARDPATINVDSLLWLNRASLAEGDAFLEVRDQLTAAIRILSDDRKAAMLTEQRQIDEEFEVRRRPIKWVGELLENDLFEMLHERRIAAGTSKASIPNPHISIELEAKHGYDPDVASLEMIARDLPPDEAAKLVTIIPEYDEPETTVVVPAKHHSRQVFAGNTVSILALIKKYAGNPIATAIDAALGRKVISERLTVKPRAAAPQSVKAPSRAHEGY